MNAVINTIILNSGCLQNINVTCENQIEIYKKDVITYYTLKKLQIVFYNSRYSTDAYVIRRRRILLRRTLRGVKSKHDELSLVCESLFDNFVKYGLIEN